MPVSKVDGTSTRRPFRRVLSNAYFIRWKWPVYDTEIVAPEYSLGGGRRADYALCHPPREPAVSLVGIIGVPILGGLIDRREQEGVVSLV